MDLQSLKTTAGSRARPKRVGRGMSSGHGKTSGKGHKGQMARSGHKRKPGFEGGQMRITRRIPKRGFHNITRIVYVPVNVGQLALLGQAEVDLETLKKAGLTNAAAHGVKILGNGELDKKLVVKAQAFSKSAKAKIEAAGGRCEVVPVRPAAEKQQ